MYDVYLLSGSHFNPRVDDDGKFRYILFSELPNLMGHLVFN